MATRAVRISIFALLVFAGALLFAALYFRHLLITPYKNYSEPRIAVTISRGTSLNSIATLLQQKGIIRSPWLLKAIFLIQGTEGQGKAGDYVFDRPLTPWEVHDKLLKGEMTYKVVTVPEGANQYDVRDLLVRKQMIKDANEFQGILESIDVQRELQSIDPSISSPEGFLFPETYFLSKNDTVEKLALMMIRQFKKEYGEQERRRANELGMTTLQVVTLASLIEKETAEKSERPLISGVFHNRLTRSMLLQCDPTVIYALKLANGYQGYLTTADLKKPSPYNTYVTPGLPPGPICNPGKLSIEAALHPQETDKLYFVSKNDGSHHFSATLAEHNRAVQQYQRR
jgi:UPF0755 protein